jgi:hypothetical protein
LIVRATSDWFAFYENDTTNTRRQAELVSLLARSVAALRPSA